MRPSRAALVTAAALMGWACVYDPPESKSNGPGPINAENHERLFPIIGGAHALGRVLANGPLNCESCHSPGSASFSDVSCTGCHEHRQPLTDRLHLGEAAYAFASQACLGCHPAGTKVPVTHTAISNDCAMCHDTGAVFASLPVQGFTHPPLGGADCSGCHAGFTDWKGASGLPGGLTRDPRRDLVVRALVPTYSGTSIARVTAQDQVLPMPMAHVTQQVAAAAFSACSNCHSDSTSYFPGLLHSSLANLDLPAPARCSDCHQSSMPVGLVGALATRPARTPASGEMKHDAVLWSNGAPTPANAVPQDCGVCHVSPSQTVSANWSTGRSGSPRAQLHAALTAAGQAQPSSCVDCHANTRPTSLLTSANAALPAGMEFDHSVGTALGDCQGCHAASAASGSWAGGLLHPVGGQTPSTCLPCHAGARPTSTAGWVNPNYRSSPFDYVTNADGVTHGAGQDCKGCHDGPGTGAWGGTQNWALGRFPHGPGTLAATTCIGCHTTQRPAAVVMGFDHARDGTGDCFGCHQATVTANRYVALADWRGGIGYPGSTFVASATQLLRLNTLTLNRSGAGGLVSSTSTVSETLHNGFLHDSSVLPAALNAGPTGAPEGTKCWHCHTSTNGTVTAYSNGWYHAALSGYRASPAGPVTPFPQPARCLDCHRQTLPLGIAQKSGSNLVPMQHGAEFAQPAVIGGVSVTKVSQMECGICHRSPGGSWADGVFHTAIGNATPKECVSCHYPLMADPARADVTSGTLYRMQHKSGQVTFQACEVCHTMALGRATTVPAAAALWRTGALHSKVTPQPAGCVDCHAVSDPLASTRSSWSYTFARGGTPTNGPQWMSHRSGVVAGKDCVRCHAADAKPSGSAWSKATVLHAPATAVPTCAECHGLTNGGGGVPGTNNNMPAGLTDSTTVTSASAATGVPAGTRAQISHADVNVSSRECKTCHLQAGLSSTPGVQGKEWAQAKLHVSLGAGSPLISNGTTGRCSNCHLNVRPGPTYPGVDHTRYTSAPGTTDCSSCHSWPGTGTTLSPNWKGASGYPPFIAVGGFTIARPPAAAAGMLQQGINNLPHPPSVAGQGCDACHAPGGGSMGNAYRPATGYDHGSPLINANCNSCHEAGSDLVSPGWNSATTMPNGRGDTRPFTLPAVVTTYKYDPGNPAKFTFAYANHFYPADCSQCHLKPSGTVMTSTGLTYVGIQYDKDNPTAASRWAFPHCKQLKPGCSTIMTNPAVCQLCHRNGEHGVPRPL